MLAERTLVDIERLPVSVAAVDATLEDTELRDAAPDAEAAEIDACSVPDALAALALTEVAAEVDRDEVELRPVTEAPVVLVETNEVAACKCRLGSKLEKRGCIRSLTQRQCSLRSPHSMPHWSTQS